MKLSYRTFVYLFDLLQGAYNMGLFGGKSKQRSSLVDLLEQVKKQKLPDSEQALILVVELVKTMRPTTKLLRSSKFSEQQVILLTHLLKSDEQLLDKFKALVARLFVNTDLTHVMVGSGLMEEGSFMGELLKRIKHKLLPPLPDVGSFTYVIGRIFYKHSDYKWVSGISTSVWLAFFKQLGLRVNLADEAMYAQLVASLRILSSKIAVIGIESSVTEKLGAGKRSFNAFVALGQYMAATCEAMLVRGYATKEELAAAASHIAGCRLEIQLIRRMALTKGVGLKETYNIIRLSKTLDRMELIFDLVDGDDVVDLANFVGYFKSVVEFENTKNKLGAYIGQNMELLAYRITEHGHSTGEHYITSTAKEYKSMLKSAAKGGFIISFIAIAKNILHFFVRFAPFWEGFVYSVNYAVGFVVIQLTGSTLATKQPAMTASAIAKTMTTKRFGSENMAELAITVSKVMRSQTASFMGNLLVAFPVVFILSALFHLIFGFKIAEGAGAQGLLDAQNPLRSLCVLYACFTGVFLFISGLISGYFENKVIYRRIPERLKLHPVLLRVMAPKALDRFSNFIGKNLGLLAGNISLGFLLGFASFFGTIFGLPFDIRHVTISTANLAMGSYGLWDALQLSDFVWTCVGVALIGFFNFFVSFSLALFVAARSRGIRLKQYPLLVKYLRILFFRYPLDFVRPPKTLRVVSDILLPKEKKAKEGEANEQLESE